jgi:hypothetical protein
MRLFSLISSTFLLGLVNAYLLEHQAQASPSPKTSVANLPDGIYLACPQNAPQGCPYHFEFRKTNSRIVGYFMMADDDICIEGKVNNNTVTGFALERSSRTYTKSQASMPRFKGANLQEWIPGLPVLRVARQKAINIPIKSADTQLYSVWWQYNSASLNLNDYRAEQTSSSAKIPQSCQVQK